MEEPGTSELVPVFDFATGFGFVQADAAIAEALTIPPPANTAPTVSVGPDQTITLPANAVLDGTVTDDGLKEALTFSWSRVDVGPGTVTIVDPTLEDTTASFSIAGTYVLRLTADDGELQASSEVTIFVNDIIQVADLSIQKVADQNRPRRGSPLKYTITVTNNGPDNATGVSFIDTLPSEVTLDETSLPDGCSPDETRGIVTCQIGSMNKGDVESRNISVLLNNKGRIENRVTVSGNEQDPSLSNNEANRRTRVR
jgi:uncharacterized repeat protein (TIGR01451 family)